MIASVYHEVPVKMLKDDIPSRAGASHRVTPQIGKPQMLILP